MSLMETLGKGVLKLFGSSNERILKKVLPLVDKINSLEDEYIKLSDEKLSQKTLEFKKRLKEGQTLDDILPESFAVVREAARRILGMRHYDVQLLGGIVLHQGKIAEMVTGEGKTLVATAPAYLNALTAKHVHVITVNDYLARRDRDWMGPVYEFLGLTVGCIQSHMDPHDRIPEYMSDITYGTNNEYGFDYLRDNMKMSIEEQCQKNLFFAIIDEVDSVLVDEARTPLIISGPAEESTNKYYKARDIVKKLEEGKHFELKEKEQLAMLSDEGIERAEKLAGVDSFYKGKNMDWPHQISQALRALHFYKREREYIVEEGQIVIIDEHTGRKQEGRVWSDGLHQAIEAKEGLKVREENQTLATITFQNYFRLFEKLGGMTGTAMTEAMEFDKIYKLEVVEIPPNRPLKRYSHNDVIYSSERDKFLGIAKEVLKYHSIGAPLLIGTISIEKSEDLSRILQSRNIHHQVLNAKHHEKEAVIITKAGQLGAITIATNMAGRGTDIVLGTFSKQQLLDHWKSKGVAPKKLALTDPNLEEKLTRHWGKHYLKETDMSKDLNELQAELELFWDENKMAHLQLCESVKNLGGLHIIGTERHDSRRIDNQLRGRAGRQGDPGCSRFYLAFDDPLLRKFAPDSMVNLMNKLGMGDGQDLQHPLLNRGIEKAQTKVEGYNFEIRKSLLDYDEIMDLQRKHIYSERQKVLEGENLRSMVWDMIEKQVYKAMDEIYLPENAISAWDFKGLSNWLYARFRVVLTAEELQSNEFQNVEKKIHQALTEKYDQKEKELGENAIRALERYILLDAIDSKWKDHLYAMDELRSSIGVIALGQVDPKQKYKQEGMTMFTEMQTSIEEEVTNLIFKLEMEERDMDLLDSIWNPDSFIHNEHEDYRSSMDREAYEQAQQSVGETAVKTIRRNKPKVGRNDPCTCGSGKKYKKCCGKGK